MAAQNPTDQFARFSFFLGLALIVSFLSGNAYSANLTLAWDANNEPDLLGYYVFCGESSGNYTISHDITSSDPNDPPPTTCDFTGLEEGEKYYFAAIAYSENGQSGYSQEISYTIPVTSNDFDDDNDGHTVNDGDCNDSDPTVHPGAPEICGDGIDQDCSGADIACPDDNSLVRDAETGVLSGAFEVGSDPAASNGQYVYVPNGVGTRFDGPDDTHKITYTFNLLEEGTYRIKGAVYAANGSDDSFWVKVNDSPAGGYLWDVLQNTGYLQEYVNDRNGADPVEVSLPAGVNTVTVYLREDGTRLDRIELEPVATAAPASDLDGDGYTENQGDCSDTNSDINPGATDICGDGIDQDCSGSDLICPEDIDNDGDGYTENQGDCNDNSASVHPGAEEICGDGIDQDCNGSDLTCVDVNIDSDNDGLTDFEEVGTYYTDPHNADTDGDGFSDGEEVASGFDPTDQYSQPAYGLVLEAEDGDLIGAFEVGSDPAASSGQYVYVPNGVGTRFDGPDDTHKITYTFNLLEEGTYRIKGAVYAANGSDDSFWVKVNDSPAGGYLWDVLQNTGYLQEYVNDRNGADPVEVSLPAGVNTVTVYLREDGTRLDKIELEPVATAAPASDEDGDGYTAEQGDCNDTNSDINPGATDICGDGVDQDCSGADFDCPVDNSLVRDAETGVLSGAFEVVSDPAASSGQYVYVPNGVGRRFDGPDDTHKIIYTFNLLEGGTYRIKGAVYAANTNDNSFWIRANDSPTGGYLWDVLQNTGYQQDYVNDRNGADPVEVSLPAGVNTVTVYLREDGTRLDRIELEPVATAAPVSDLDGDGYTENQSDCNDTNSDINPGATDICGDGIDQDCSGADLTCPEDTDNDSDGYTENQGDCNDNSASVYPDAMETCGDGIDQDCDGSDLTCVDLTKDSDNDGLTDYEEENTYFTDPNNADTDGDGFSDGEEVAGGFDPNNTESKPDPRTTELPIEFGEIELDHQWKTVTLNRSFVEPVVIAGAMSYAQQDPAVIRVRNVNHTSFEVRVQEWDYLDGQHATEQVGYIVVESGKHDLAGGARVEAGRFNANAVSSFASIEFSQAFNTVPVVLTTINSVNEGDAVVMRLKNITTTGFDYRIQEQESNDKQHAPETAGYIAWEPSAGSMDGFMFEIGRTSNSVTHQFQSLPFDVPFTSPPVFLAGMQTTDGSDTAAVRWQGKQATGVEVKVEEEQSRDTETNHTSEVIGYAVFEAENATQDDTQPTYGLVLEAEDGDLEGAFEIVSDPAASGGQYIHVPNGTGTRISGPDESHKISYTFYVPGAGTYRIKGAVYAANTNDNSFWIRANDSPPGGYLWDVLRNTGYQQDYVNDRNGADPVEVSLGEGPNTVTVYLREDGTRLDKIELEPVD